MSERIWTCKIGGNVAFLREGADYPMRKAVEEAFVALTGVASEFNFSGWGGSLNEPERAVVENRLPNPTYDDILIAHEKHGPVIYKSALSCLASRVQEEYWYDGKDQARAAQIVKDQDEEEAANFLADRYDAEYEYVEWVTPI